MYREWLKKAMSAKQAPINCVSLSVGPYFQGWAPCRSSGSKVVDVEDLGSSSCAQDCTIPSVNAVQVVVDDSWYIPNQRGVDNSAYTWRRDRQLGRGVQPSSSWWPSLTSLSAIVLVAVGAAAGIKLLGK
jgi:hypothetical protein